MCQAVWRVAKASHHGLLNISIWTGNERKKQRVGGQVEACAVVRLRIWAAIACKQAATFHFRKFFCTADISTVLYTRGNKSAMLVNMLYLGGL